MIRVLVMCFALSGCAVTGSKQVAVACQAADAGTTAYALNHGAREANPIFAEAPVSAIVAVKALFALLLWVYHDAIGNEAMTAINVVTCGAAVHNLRVIRDQKRINER